MYLKIFFFCKKFLTRSIIYESLPKIDTHLKRIVKNKILSICLQNPWKEKNKDNNITDHNRHNVN